MHRAAALSGEEASGYEERGGQGSAAVYLSPVDYDRSEGHVHGNELSLTGIAMLMMIVNIS